MNDWLWLCHTLAGMIVGFVLAVGAWSAAAQVQRNGDDDRRPEPRDRDA